MALYTDAANYSVYKDKVEAVCHSPYRHLDFENIQFGRYDDLLTLGMFSFATFEFRRNDTIDLFSFNGHLTQNEIPEITLGEMLFLDEGDFYYASLVKYSDLTAYCGVLLSSSEF